MTSVFYDYVNLDYKNILYKTCEVDSIIIKQETDKLYFLHLPKTAGGKLSHNVKNNENSSVKFYPVDHGFNIHNSFKLAPQMGGFQYWPGNYFKTFEFKEGLKNSLKFTFIRNPFDWLTSYYFHSNHGWADFNLVHKFKTFDEFIEAYCDPSYQWHCPLLKKFIYSPLFGDFDKCNVDFIIKYENMENSLKKLNEYFDIKLFDLDYKTNKDNVSLRKKYNYKEYYTPYLRNLVEKKCKRELELFNYDFDNSDNSENFIYPNNLNYNITNDVVYLKKYS